MHREQQIAEVKALLELVAGQTTALADTVMALDVSEYTDSSRFERECRALFRDYPQFVGPSCLLPNPGDYFAFDDTGVPILVVRQDSGELRAMLEPLMAAGNGFRPLAMELNAILLLRDGERAAAQQVYGEIADDLTAPPGLRARAAQVLASLAEDPPQ